MEILRLEVEPTIRSILGETSNLQGTAKIHVDGTTMEIPLSPETIHTIQECVKGDFIAVLSTMFERKAG